MPIKKRVVKNVKQSANRGDAKNNKMIPFGRAVANFFKKYFQFSGVATRAEYWWTVLFVLATVFGTLILARLLFWVSLFLSGVLMLLFVAFCIGIIVPMWTLMSRRLHDAGFSAKLLWISFIFFVYSLLVPRFIHASGIVEFLSIMWEIIMLVLFLLPSKKQNNPYRD